MRYEVTLRIFIRTRSDEERVARQLESLFEFGTLRESIVDALRLNESPRLSSIHVEPASDDRTR
jgi:hypothetical protein